MEAGIRFPNLGLNLPYIGKGFEIFGFEIRYYGIIITIGFLLGYLLATREAKRTGQDPETYLDYLIVVILPAIIGARLYFVIFSWDQYRGDWLEIINTRNGGMAIYGGIIVAVAVLLIFCRVRKKSFFLMGDTAVMSLLVGQILGRWGNFFNMEAFGGYTNNLFAMQLPIQHVDAGMLTQAAIDGAINIQGVMYIQVHPTFLYESLWNLAVLLIVFLYRKHKKFDGELVALYLIGYGIGRFWIEGLRIDQLTIGNTGLAVSQILAFILVLVGIGFIMYKKVVRKSERHIM